MAALTEGATRKTLATPQRHYQAPVAAAAQQVYKGSMLVRVAATGLVSVASASQAAADSVVGFSEEDKLTVSGDKVKAETDCVKLVAQDGSIDQTMVGQLCYVVDDNTVTEDGATGTPPLAGVVHSFVSSSAVYVAVSYNPARSVAVNPSP